ncbi:ribonuclease E/G, partial [Paracoccus sp. (in: a-proteobacteria)]
MPLYGRYQVESYLAGMFNPVVQLKSGGYIVIGVTEALVAIDVNSGRATKEGSIEETALKTNLEAAEEIARQLRLRDLAGLIVIDFIDMEERKNNASVEKRFKEKLKTDRARIQVGRISGFGLLEMSRQRLRPGMLESTTQPCAHCHGTGLIRSDDSLALTILRAIEEEGTRKRSREVLVKAPVAVANFLMNAKREHIANIEARYGLSVRVEADPALISPDYAIEKFKTATRNVPEVTAPVVSVDARLMAQIDDEEPAEDEAEETVEAAEIVEAVEAERAEDSRAENGEGEAGKRRRRRRRRRGGKNGEGEAHHGEDDAEDAASEAEEVGQPAEAEAAVPAAVEVESAPKPAAEEAAEEVAKPRRRTRTRRRKADEPADEAAAAGGDAVAQPGEPVEPVADEIAEAVAVDDQPAAQQPAPTEVVVAEQPAEAPEPAVEPVPEAAEPAVAEAAQTAEQAEAAVPEASADENAGAEVAAAASEPAEVEAVSVPEPAPEPALAEETSRPKRRGWWSVG